MRRLLATVLILSSLAPPAWASELHPPAQVTAGSSFTIGSSGSGKATLYLVGPAHVSKNQVRLGGGIVVAAEEVKHAGRYTAIVCDGEDCTSAHFVVNSAAAAQLSLLVHPSRVRVAEPNAISAVALVFDKFHNLVLAPTEVEFKAIPRDGQPIAEARASAAGIAWIRLTSGRREGPVKVGASVGPVSELRVVQQVASDACNLRITPDWVSGKLYVQTDPVRDCSGNPVPDGTVVSFTKMDASGKTSVDVPIKRGVARVEVPVAGNAHVFAASGVVTGNELNLAGKP
jgi:hypothetical protein